MSKYAELTNSKLTSTALKKYNLSLDDSLNILDEDISKLSDYGDSENLTTIENTNESELEVPESIPIEKLSTLYTLSNDIEESCDDFCELKQNISNAIIETQNLIKKVQNKEVELSHEQRMFITEQAQQLKNLGRQLSNITTELSFNLSDLNQISLMNNNDIDNLSLKYLVVLDNLINGNEMLQSGLSSLNMINQMFNMNNENIPSNNQGRILYGFRQNNNPPVIKDYYINENGELIENNQNSNITNEEAQEELNDSSSDNSNNIDTYQSNSSMSNIDTYNTARPPKNIDSFFNTALLDNDFMYGNGNLNYGMGYGMNNPYFANYTNYQNNATDGVNNDTSTQNEKKNENKKEKKKFRLKKNIDTFKDENEPDIKTKLTTIKNSISGFFNKFKKSDLNDKLDNPIARYNSNDKINNENN